MDDGGGGCSFGAYGVFLRILVGAIRLCDEACLCGEIQDFLLRLGIPLHIFAPKQRIVTNVTYVTCVTNDVLRM